MSGGTLLEARGLTKRFGGLTAVDGLDFDVRRGEILGLIGPNGAGKTTTFNLIAGALAPTSGSIAFEGEQIQGLKPHVIAAHGIMRTFQHNMPFAGMSLLENVLVGAHVNFAAQGAGLGGIVAGSAKSRATETISRRCWRRRSRRCRSARGACSRSRACSAAGRSSCCSTNPRPDSRPPRRSAFRR